MKCPVDGATLAMSDRHGIEIDYCPECRGVWLDRGELDKVIERNAQEETPVRPPRNEYREDQRQERRDEYRDREYRDNDDYRGHHKKRKESWLSELFD